MKKKSVISVRKAVELSFAELPEKFHAPFFFAFLFRIKLNYKINENNCKNIWQLQNNVVYL